MPPPPPPSRPAGPVAIDSPPAVAALPLNVAPGPVDASSSDDDVKVSILAGPDGPPSAVAGVKTARLRFAPREYYFTGGNTLVVGDEGAGTRDAGLARLAAAVGASEAASSGRLHVLVRLRDVDAVRAVTRDGRAVGYERGGAAGVAALPVPETAAAADAADAADADAFSFRPPPDRQASGRSALTAALGVERTPRMPRRRCSRGTGTAAAPAATSTASPLPACDCACADCSAAATADTPSRALVVRGRVLPAASPVASADDGDDDDDGEPILHLVVRRGGRLALARAPEGGFELSVCSSLGGSARALAVAAAAAAGEAAPQRLLLDGCELPPDEPLASAGVRPGAILELVPADGGGGGGGAPSPAQPVPAPTVARALDLPPPSSAPPPSVLPPPSPSLASPLHSLHGSWLAARAGLAAGRAPELAPAGSGGSYFLRDAAGVRVAVFKPADEEPDGACNPRGGGGSSGGLALASASSASSDAVAPAAAAPHRGVLPGEGAAREVAAYVIDGGVFAGVPPTALVDCDQIVGDGGGGGGGAGGGAAASSTSRRAVVSRRGALQAFVPSVSDAEETGPHAFALSDVHRIAALDVRLLNTDRNGGNILVSARGPADGGGAAAATHTGAASPYRLVPIDHAFTLPSSLAAACRDATLDWAHWPQARLPVDPPTRAAILAFDADADVAACAAAGVPLSAGAADSLRYGTALLQAAVGAGRPPADWAAAVCRPADGDPVTARSPLERLATAARERTGADADGRAVLARFKELAAEYFGGLAG